MFGLDHHDSDSIVVSTNQACLHKSDLEVSSTSSSTLKHDEWLGDNVLAFHAEWLDALAGQLNPSGFTSDVKMFPPSVVELLVTLDSAAAPHASSVVPRPNERFLILPISDRYSPSSPAHASAGSHWSLLLVDAATRFGFHLDSLGDCNRTAANAVHSSILKLIQPANSRSDAPPVPIKVDCLQQQQNGSDCGIYVLLLSSLLQHRLNTPAAASYDLFTVVETVCADSSPKVVAKFRKAYLRWLQAWGKATHHEEHVDPTQKVKSRFLDLFSEIGVE
ncbi:uncharacterized protein UTRI_04166_B [Ustilago trichophora]|uniref:Ubiquitin-like protease family profile domain-containing protein n=1 Tax=Ustilago trichophora TaxID=86804 RepID=A0A5C3E7Z2_9BASI|nr:uncharacterized protein UTRI_04166_B [Ustilago trichophora]